MKTYLKLFLSHLDFGHRTKFMEEIKKTVVCELTERDGDAYIDVLSDKDLMHECFSLGVLYSELRVIYGLPSPFLWDLVYEGEE